ncbi:hypothetical protein JCM9743_37080 [Natrinema sp. JCM 9743]
MNQEPYPLPAPIESDSRWVWEDEPAREIVIDSVAVYEDRTTQLRLLDGGESKLIDLESFVERVEDGRLRFVAGRYDNVE